MRAVLSDLLCIKLSKIEDCVKDIKQWMLINYLWVNSDKTEVVFIFVTFMLDYCTALLSGCRTRSINKLQLIQNAAA